MFITESLATIDKVVMLSENTLFFIQMFHIKYISSSEATVLFVWEYNLYYIEGSCLVKAKENVKQYFSFYASISTVSNPSSFPVIAVQCTTIKQDIFKQCISSFTPITSSLVRKK